MGILLLIVRLALVIPWTVGLFLLRLCVMPTALVSPALERRARAGVLRIWARGTWLIAGMQVEVRGTPPQAPFFLVSNHLTYLDVVALSGVVGCVFTSKAEVARWPVIGWMASGMQTIFINRESMRDTVRVNELIHKAFSRGFGVHVFAEGGVPPELTVSRFKPPLLEPAVRLGYPVHYVAISYRTPEGEPPAREVVAWPQGVSFGAHIIRILRVRRFYTTLHFGPEPILAEDRKVLADKLCEGVRALYTPLN